MRLDQKETVKRLVIYFFYDADGIVDRYVSYMLADVVKNCTELFVVCNGKLTAEGRKTFKKFTPYLLVRENVGFDVWAYKEALEHYGWDELGKYDEVVMMNHTIMGPLFPFAEMFEAMNGRDVDFWGITVFHKNMVNPFNISYGYIPEHIQSHFIAVRNDMLLSPEFQSFWDNRPPIESYEDSVGKHEAIFTKYFSDKGFTWDKYVDTDDLKGFTFHPISFCPQRLIEEKRCPIIKRKTFFHPYEYLIETVGGQAKQLIDYLTENSLYDVGLIWENILRTCHMSDIRSCTNLSWIMPKNHFDGTPGENTSVALILHIYYEDLINYCYHYSLSMPENADIYITTDTVDKQKQIEHIFSAGPWRQVQVILIDNRGRDISALLVGAAKYAYKYDCVCFAHDKKVTKADEGIVGFSFSCRYFENILGSRAYVNNIISKFEAEPHLGLLCPPPPKLGPYYGLIGQEWGCNYQNTKKLYDDLGLSVPIHEDKEPIAPFGTMFWFRPKALKKLFGQKWNYDDFPEEPIPSDGTLLHAVECIYPYVVQEAGFYTAWCVNDYYASTEHTNLHFMLRRSLIENREYNEGCGLKKITPRRRKIKALFKAIFPTSIWRFLKKAYHALGGRKWVG